MQFLCFFLFITCATAYLDYSDEEPEKVAIVGGKIKEIKEIPYVASILYHGAICCGAAIIADQWLVSAAHCFDASLTYTVRTGTDQLKAIGNRHAIESIIPHPDYNPITLDSDIALLKLSKPMILDHTQQPILLATKNEIPKTGDKLIVSGFGKEGDYKGPSKALKSATAPVVDFYECKKAYNSINSALTTNMICAGKGSTDACQGDSGGPGIINGKLAGIVSSGMECGSKTFPGIYTAVYKFHNWIIKHTGNLNNRKKWF